MPHNCSALCDTTMHSNCNGKASFYNSNSASCKCKLTAKRDHESLEKRSSYVYLKDGRCQGRPWTKRKKYLLTFSVLLIAVCIALVIITFILVRKGYDFNLNKCDTFGSCLQKCTTVIGSNKCECQKGYILINDTHCFAEAAQLLDSVDSEINPCDDFFQYACGAWNRKHLIPEDASSYNTFEKLHDKLQIILRGLLEEPISNEDSSSTIKAKVLYKSCMNTSQIESVGDKPLQEVLKSLGGWPVVKKNWNPLDFNLERLLGRILGELNTPILIKSWVAADDKNSSANIIQLDQSRLGMPSKEYYLNDRGSEYIETYRQYMIGVAKLLGAEDQKAKQELENVLQFEIKLANISKPQNERHDTGALYAKFTLKHLQKLAPSFDWLVYFNTFIPILITENEEITTIASEYLVDMIKLVKNTSSRTIANYIFWRLALRVIPDMTSKYRRLTYNYNKVLEGITKEKVRWEKCVETINKKLGMALGAMFVKEHFKKENKETALEMIHNIREAFNELLEENDWMDNETKVVAREKANAMNERIGYPEFIIDKKELDKLYETLTFNEYEYFKNMLKIAKYEAEKDMNKLRNPVYKDRWDQEPAVVNAFYIPNTNDIVLPAGILQPLFYSHHFPKSLNYGGIGVVIGHEITHGFDDKGRLYDKDGNIKQWWKNETIQEFRDRAQCMIDQYSGYKLEQIGSYINGKNTLGENIADNGGLKQAYRAYHRWVKKHGEESLIPGIGLTHDQLFFLNYAQIWCGKMRNEEALQKIRTSFHSPGPIRVLGPLSNSKDFAKAYHCPLGSRMNPVHKCSLW